MVHVGTVGMIVLDRFVRVPVAVCSDKRRNVHMRVMHLKTKPQPAPRLTRPPPPIHHYLLPSVAASRSRELRLDMVPRGQTFWLVSPFPLHIGDFWFLKQCSDRGDRYWLSGGEYYPMDGILWEKRRVTCMPHAMIDVVN
jgi:hypothetical protein